MSGTIEAYAGILPGTTQQLDFDTPGGAGSAGVAVGTGTGQHGTALVDRGLGSPFVSIWQWINTPFRTPMSPWDITLLVGVVLIAVLAWNLILYHVRIAAEAI